jgi:hypothetical protein
MRKKVLMFLLSFLAFVGVAKAQTVTIEASTSVNSPEHQYVMKSGNNYWAAANTAPTKHKLGRFAFFAVTDTDDGNDYKIYSIDLQKWVSYTKASSYSNCTDFAKLVDDQAEAQPWNVVVVTKDGVKYHQLAPYNNTSVAAKYMNWYGGINNTGYSYDESRTVGLWQSSATDDEGSRWTISKYTDLGALVVGDNATTWETATWWTTADYGGSNVLPAVKAVEDAANEKLIAKLPADLQDVFSSLLTGDADEELKPLVKSADKLSALIKCIEERKAGNTEFCEAEAATRKRILEANVPEAEVFLEEFIPAYELTLDRL